MSLQGNLAEIKPRPLRLDAGFPQAKLVLPTNAVAVPVSIPAASPWVKRATDLFLAIPALFLLAPILLGIAVLIVLDSRGPVFFRQTRTGHNGQPFSIFKFRSMSVLENGDHIMQARQNDPRVTRVGRLLRRTSLDELPQLINVIAGEMSLVGPRPHAKAHDKLYATLIQNYPQRQLAKPGITGWAQVHGLRGETPTVESMRERVDFDLWYVKHANFALDVEILFRTVFEIFRRTNAY